jgi:hypothetical protein
MSAVTVRVHERDFPFVVQVPVPDGGFECALGAIDAWHHYQGSPQRRGPCDHAAGQEFWSWCFDGLEIAKAIRHRFGGEILPVSLRARTDRGSGLASRRAAAKSAPGSREQGVAVRRAGAIPG